MGIAQPPSNSPAIHIASSEGRNVDQWASLNLNQFVPDALQQAIDALNELLDVVSGFLELALAAVRLAAALTSEVFSLLKAIINAIADNIKSLLDLFPKLSAGLYFMYIPTQMGGNDYFRSAFVDSLRDPRDTRKPPMDGDIPFRALFFMWGCTWYDTERQRELAQIGDGFKKFFGIDEKVDSGSEVPEPVDFAVEKGFFVKAKTELEQVVNTVEIPNSLSIDGVQNQLKTMVSKYKRTSDKAGISHSVSWEMPPAYGAFSREHVKYDYKFRAGKVDKTKSYIFTKTTTKLIGIDIIRTESLEDMGKAKARLRNRQYNESSMLGPGKYHSHDEDWSSVAKGAAILHRDLSSAPGSNFLIDFPPDPEHKNYFYAAAFVYTKGIAQIYGIQDENGKYTVTQVTSTNKAGKVEISKPDPESMFGVNLADLRASDLKYPKDELVDSLSFIGPVSQTVVVSNSPMTAPIGGAQPDWISFKAIPDLVPELGKLIAYIKNIVDNIVAGVLDDASALEAWIQEYIATMEDMIQKAQKIVEMLQSLILPPMAGVHMLSLNTQFGMPAIIDRFDRSLELAMRTDNSDYSPLLLDTSFKDRYPEEYKRRINIPPYDVDHMTGGFILAFQEPAVGAFLEGILGISDSFSDEFTQILNDSRLRIKSLHVPELREYHVRFSAKRNRSAVVVDNVKTDPSVAMHVQSRNQSGLGSTKEDPVNSDGDVEVTSGVEPFVNNSGPLSFSIATTDANGNSSNVSIIIPKGELSAKQIAELLNSAAKRIIARLIDNGSFVIASRYLKVSPCSEEAALLLGIDPKAEKFATDSNPKYDSEPFEYSEGDMLVTFVNNGKPTMEMLQATPAIFQLNEFNGKLLNENSHLIKIDINETSRIVDVTGNAGTNSKLTSVKWEYKAVFPFKVEKGVNDKFYFGITCDQRPELPIGLNEIVMRPLIYRTIHDLSAEILQKLTDSYPVGLFSTQANATEDGATLFLLDKNCWGTGTTLSIQPGTGNDFLASLVSSDVIPATDYDPYTIQEVIDNLNNAFPVDYFKNIDNKITIMTQGVGTGNVITVYSSKDNLEYGTVAQTIFGLPSLLSFNSSVEGIGTPRLSNEYIVEDITQDVCVEFVNADKLIVEDQAPELIVEILNTVQQDYVIEFV